MTIHRDDPKKAAEVQEALRVLREAAKEAAGGITGVPDGWTPISESDHFVYRNTVVSGST